MFSRVVRRYPSLIARSAKFSTETTALSTSTPVASKAKASGGFFDRFFGFLIGTGCGFGASFYFIEEELKKSNTAFSKTLNDLQSRVAKLEKK